MNTKSFTTYIRVYYEDTDTGGIVYHSNYLNFAERARTELLRTTGYNHITLQKKHNAFLVVKKIDIDFISYARLDDRLKLVTTVKKARVMYFDFEQLIYKKNTLITIINARICSIDKDGKLIKMPINI